MKKILITSVGAGSGHIKAAQAVEQYLNTQFTVSNIDSIQLAQSWFKYLCTDFYIKLVNSFPQLWKLIYQLSDKPSHPFIVSIRQFIQNKTHRKFIDYVVNYQPDIVISTHFMPPEILFDIRKKYQLDFKILVVVTDFDVHGMWINSNVDHYFVAGEQAKQRVIEYGISENKITVAGIPVQPKFFHHYSAEEKILIEQKWNINPNKKKILMMAGGAGIGHLDKIVEKLLILRTDIQLITVAGNNAQLLDKLNKISSTYSNNILPIGFTNDIHELMLMSDIVITKPGGLSTSECLAMKKPMILLDAIPGQEEHNAYYLTSLHIAQMADNIEENINQTLENLPLYQSRYNELYDLNSQQIIIDFIKSL